MGHDWVKAIGKKLREDLGDCPTLPQELEDVLDKLAEARQVDCRYGRTSNSNGKRALTISSSGHQANIYSGA